MVPCLQFTLNEFLNDNKIYSPLEYPCSSVPSLIIMDLKYMLKRSTQRLSDIHRVCLMIEHNMLVV
jgi:hypothetical protein